MPGAVPTPPKPGTLQSGVGGRISENRFLHQSLVFGVEAWCFSRNHCTQKSCIKNSRRKENILSKSNKKRENKKKHEDDISQNDKIDERFIAAHQKKITHGIL